MNIFPMNKSIGDRKHWVVRWLRYDGYLVCTAATIAGFVLAIQYGSLLGFVSDEPLASILRYGLPVLGALFGFVAGLGISLPFWGMAMIIDDLHALRIYASGYVAIGDREMDG